VTDPLEARLQEISAAFSAQVPGRVREIRALWEGVKASGWTGASTDLRRLVHSLKGGGRTFGHPAITDCARRIEEAMEEVGSVPQDPRAEAVRRLEALIGELERMGGAPPC
jgi:chemotaxis protein histidine kinase CheA